MNIELENNSAPALEKFFEEREDILGVMFDVDNTLFVTDKYFNDITYSIGMDVAEYMDIRKPSWIIAEELQNQVSIIFKKNNYHPRLMNEQIEEALKEYLDLEEISESMQEILDYWLKDFYHKSPQLNENAVMLLSELRRCNKMLGLHSHAQQEWTGIKAEVLSEELKEDVPYFTTDISVVKDKEQWIKSCSIINLPIENVLIVGDSFYADILPGIQAGCRHLIWIDRYGKGIPADISIPEDVELIRVEDIKEILSL